MNAKFITLDGIDGAGKTTQLNVIRNWFEAHQLPVIFTREPGGTPLGEQLRDILLNPRNQIDLRTETLLVFASRQQHLHDVILPHLQQGIHVVSDRFTDATFAYQGGGRGLPEHDIAQLENWVQGDFRPDLTILLDVPLETALERIESGRDAKDRFEQENGEFFNRVRQAYLQRAHASPDRYTVVDSSHDKHTTQTQIEQALARLFQQS